MLSAKELQYHLSKCAQNNRESQKKIYRNFCNYARVICQHYISSNGDVTEILNDGFLEAFIKIYQFRPSVNAETSFKVWLKKIMICAAIDYCWKNNKYNVMPELMKKNTRIPDGQKNFFDKISYTCLKAFMGLLTPDCRTVFTLFVMEGFNHEEIARELNMSNGNCKSNLSKAREYLRKMINKELSQADVCNL